MINEDQLERRCIDWFREGGLECVFDSDIAHDGDVPEHVDYRQVVLMGRLLDSMARKTHLTPNTLCRYCSFPRVLLSPR